MGINKKCRCWACISLSIIKWGRGGGKQRFKCLNCGVFFTHRNHGVSKKNREIWFREWIIGRQTFAQLVAKSGYSERTLRNYFYDCLARYPQWNIQRRDKVNLLIDGTYFSNKACLVPYSDNTVKATVLYRLTDGEWQDELREDLDNLQQSGIIIESITCDGLSNVLKAVRKSTPDAIIQRCLVHIQRETLAWLTKYPQSEAGYTLKQIIQCLSAITNREQWGYRVVSMVHWCEKYKDFVNEKTYKTDTNRYWFTHRNVRKAFIHIKRALPDMFHYLDNPKIPKTTNGLESFLGHLKQNISLHRGLSKEHYKNYSKWYLFFKSNEK